MSRNCAKSKMFFQPPDDELNCSLSGSNTLKGSTQSRRQKKLRRKNKLKAIKKLQIASKQKAEARTPVPSFPSIPITMSSYAENFTRAATWQLKNEVAFWKSKAMALEHENQILHRALRQNIIVNDKRQLFCETPVTESFYQDDELLEDPVSSDIADEVSEKEFEVSEEYIQFLRDNMVFRESARQERERIRALNDDKQKEIEEMEAGPAENTEDHQETLKKLYGDGAERIAALEMSLKTQFIRIVDEEKPMFWPNIPFNFNFG